MESPIKLHSKDWEEWVPVITEIWIQYGFPAYTQKSFEDLFIDNPQSPLRFQLAGAHIFIEFALYLLPGEVDLHCVWIKSIAVVNDTEHKVATVTSVLHTNRRNSSCSTWSKVDQSGFSIVCCADWVTSFRGLDYVSKYEYHQLNQPISAREAHPTLFNNNPVIDLTQDNEGGPESSSEDSEQELEEQEQEQELEGQEQSISREQHDEIINKMQQDLDKTQNALDKATENISCAEITIKKMKENEEVKKAEVRALLRDIAAAQKECDRMREQRDEAEKLRDNMIEQRDRARKELATAKQIVRLDDDVNQKQGRKIEEQTFELQALRDEIQRLSELHDLNKDRLIAAEATHEAGDRLLSQAQITIVRLHRQVETAEDLRDAAEHKVNELEKTDGNVSITDGHARLAVQVKKLKAKLVDAEMEKDAVNMKNVLLVSDVRKLKHQVEDLMSQQVEDSNNDIHTPVTRSKRITSGNRSLRTPTSQSHQGSGTGRDVQKNGPPPAFKLLQREALDSQQ